MLGNDELDTEMQIRKDDFVSPHCRPIMKAYLGADFDAAKTYQQMDEHGVKTKNVTITRLNFLFVLWLDGNRVMVKSY